MTKFLNKFYEIEDKIGKHNLILVIFIFFVFLVTGLYQTFSLYTESLGLSIVDGIKTYSFILNANNNTNSVTIAPGNSKNLEITVSNDSDADLLYGLYYESDDTLLDVNIGYLSKTEYLAKGTINNNSKGIVTVKIENNSLNNVTINFGLKYGFSNGGELSIDTNQYWIEEFVELTSSKYIQKLYNDSDVIIPIKIGEDGNEATVYLNEKQNILLDNNSEYRYYGKNPNNYVSFNNELWRIIGSFNVTKSEDETNGTMRLKLIKNDSIGEYSFDTNKDVNEFKGINNYSKSSLNEYLNKTYYNTFSGEVKGLLDTSLWHLGGEHGLRNYYADDYYDFERGVNTYKCEEKDTTCPRDTSWLGNVGLMYASDYAYATDLGKCNYVGGNYFFKDRDNTVCTDENWLFNDKTNWTLSTDTSNGYSMFSINEEGNVVTDTVNNKKQIRPVIYLDDNVSISGGTGTSNDPYILD